MNEQDKVLLSAYIDKQLDNEQRGTLEQRLLREPDLKQYLEQLRQTDNQLKASFNRIVDTPVPDSLQQLLGEAKPQAGLAPVIELSSRRQQQPDNTGTGQPSWLSMALAASVTLAIGIVIGQNQLASHSTADLLSQTLSPSGKLAHVLSDSASGTVNQFNDQMTVSITPELSFIDNDGHLCRQYRVQNTGNAYRGVACVIDQRWQNQLMISTHIQQHDPSAYQPASSDADQIVQQYLEQHMQGIALGSQAEQQELDKLGF